MRWSYILTQTPTKFNAGEICLNIGAMHDFLTMATLCTAPTVMQVSPALKLYGIQVRIVWPLELCIRALEYFSTWNELAFSVIHFLEYYSCIAVVVHWGHYCSWQLDYHTWNTVLPLFTVLYMWVMAQGLLLKLNVCWIFRTILEYLHTRSSYLAKLMTEYNTQ